YYIEFTANGKTANSHYELEISKINANNADDKLYTSRQQAAGQSGTYNEFNVDGSYTGDWIGFTDATDFVKLDLDAFGSGLYDINITDIDNPVKLTLHQAIRNSSGDIISYAAVKSVTLKAGTNSGVLSDLLLNKDAEYYVGITASGAAKGDNTGYKLDISKAADVLSAPDTFNTAAGSKLYTFFAPADGKGGAYNFSVDTADLAAGTSVKLTVYELLTNGRTRSVKFVTVKADTIGSTGYLYLDQDAVSNGTGIYMIEVKPVNSKTTGNCTVSCEGYSFSSYVMNAEYDNAVVITADDAATAKNWVGMGDASDTYKFTADAGESSFELAGINGNNIKISIVNAATGKAVKSFTPAANSTGYKFTYALAAGEYDIVISSADNGKSKYSEYTLDINRVEKIAPDPALVSNADDSWSLIAGDVNASASGFGDTIANWVGKGDVTDVFKINLDENGQIALDGFDAATDDALKAKEITLTLMDSNGKNIALTFDKASGVYESSIVLMADVDYYLNVKSAKPSEAGTAFNIAIK
ncbi:MAG: hypothetical protein J6Q80_02480, partial [Lentisphaeria bacterium]|nr:hypothetical protein [Lentisphaeria bacterium]